MKIKTRGRLLILIISSLMLFSVAVNTIIYFQFNNFTTNNLLKTNANLGLQLVDAKYDGEWRLENDKLYKGNVLINDNFEIVDIIKKNANVQCTIFLKDTRVSTTITENDTRAVGTKAEEKVSNAVINEGKEYIGTANVLDIPYKTIYIPIKDKSGSIIGMFFVGIEKESIDEQVQVIIFRVIVVTILLFLITTLLVTFLVNKIIIKPIKYSKEHLNLIANGDLSLDVGQEYLKKSDEFGEIANSIESMQQSIREMIRIIKYNFENIDKQSDSLYAVSQEISCSSESVSTAIQDVAKGAGSQAQDLADITHVLDEFGKELGVIVRSIKEVDINIKGINSMSDDSNGKMQSLIQSVNMVSESFKKFTTNITAFDQNVRQVNEITNFINSIADQTNMLALNASIEAVRAGEAGRGFSVVADEIRKLADQTKKSSENINDLIKGITSRTNRMVEDAGTMNGEMDNQVTVINEAIGSFRRITASINEISPKIESINDSAEGIDNEKNEILGRIQEVTSVSEEVSASAQEIAASSEEMSASTEEVASAAQVLTNMTKEMKEQVNKFKI